jgi:hypothetical protein
VIPTGTIIRQLKLGENIITRQTSIIFPNIYFKQTPIGALVPFKADIIKAGKIKSVFRCRVVAWSCIKTRINPSNIGINAFLT